MRTRTGITATSLALMLALMTLAGSPPAAAQDDCSGFDRKHTINKVGGPNALVPGGLQTRAALQTYFAAHADEIRAALASQGHGDKAAAALLAAIRDDAGITERAMAKGQQLEWMAYRKGGELRIIDKVCLDLGQDEPAFEITVPVLNAVVQASPDCSLDITTDCLPDGTGSFRVHTADGAQVTLAGPAGTRTIIDGAEPTWTGPMEDPHQADYTFTVTNAAVAMETVTTYTFLVPMACGNLALVDQTESLRPGLPVTCSDQRTLSQPGCPAPPPSCTIDLDNTEVRRGEIVGYQVTGEWTELDLELVHDGAPLTEPVLAAKSGTFAPPERGTYTVIGIATNVLGQSDECRASVEVVGTDWIARGFGAFLFVDGEQTRGDVFTTAKADCPCPASTSFGYDDGFGLGVSVERLFNERFGLEARGLYAWLDDELWIGANGIGITDSDTLSHWNLSLGLNVHLTPKHTLDWYVGPFVGYSSLGGNKSLAVDRSLQHDPESSVTWGAQTGLDWPFGASPWSLHAGARYTWNDVDVIRRYTDPNGTVTEQKDSLDINPITLELGVAYHF